MNIPNCDEFIRGIEEFEKHEKRDAMYKVATFLVEYFWDKPRTIPTIADGLGVLLLTWNQAFYRYGLFDFESLEKCISNNRPLIESFRSRNISSLSSNDDENIKDLFGKFLQALRIDSMRFSDNNIRKYTKKHLEELLNCWGIRHNATSLRTIYESIIEDARINGACEFININQNGSQKQYIQISVSMLDNTLWNSLESKKLIKKSPVAVAKALHLLAPNFFPLWDAKIAWAYGCRYNDRPEEKYVSFCKITNAMADKLKGCISRPDKTIIKLIDEYNYSKHTRNWI